MAESVDLRVELPSYAHSFTIKELPLSSTVLQVKSKICETCIGAPRVEGQRIVFRGRYLEDIEKLEDIYNAQDETSLVFHLAVHPSAWTSSPPNIAQPISQPLPSPQPQPQPSQMPRATQSLPSPLPGNHPLAYVLYMHQNALIALMQGSIIQAGDFLHSKTLAVQLVERNGWQWPPILDEPFPAPSEGGLKYERIMIDGQLYLKLRNPDDTPNAIQLHALKVLSYTFSILKQPMVTHIPSRVIPSNSVPIPPHVNQVLQQLGLPQLPNHNNNPNPNPIPNPAVLRPFLLPVALHVIRILVVLYFFAPARKPLFGLLIAWFLFELWQRGLFNNRAPAPDPAGREAPAPQQEAQAVAVPPPPNAADGNVNVPQQQHGRPQAPNQLNAVLDALANYNLREEEEMLSGANNHQPTLSERIFGFISLLTTTIHPAVWDRRRLLLRRREGRLRTEDVARQDIGEQEEQDDTRAQRRVELAALHERRTQWTQRYVQRAVAGDWVDEAD